MKKHYLIIGLLITYHLISATNYPIYAIIDGSQEIPSNTSFATGSMSGTYNDLTNILTYKITCNSLSSSISASHFHGNALAGVNTGIKATILPFISNTSSGTVSVAEADEIALLSGMWYINIHTSNYPSGEIRGQVIVPCQTRDSLALITLHTATNGTAWTPRDTTINGIRKRSPWILTDPITTWYGIGTNTEGCVTVIDLDGDFSLSGLSKVGGENLVGTIPPLDSLLNLESLFLSGNSLTGSIPNFKLPNLKDIHAYNNGLSGQIPPLNFTDLRTLCVQANQLTGPIPNFTAPNLVTLCLQENKLSGAIPDFSSRTLQYFTAHDNQLTETIPNLTCPKLEEIYISNNLLRGGIPPFKLPNLKLLYLSDNQLSGCIPREIKTQCPNIGASGGIVNNNFSLSTQVWANYWNNNEGACSLVDTTTCRYKDSLALVAFYRATMQNVQPQYKWNLSLPMTSWFGVSLSADGCVQCLDLDDATVDCDALYPNPSGIGLTGIFPDSMCLLASLVRLNLRGNTGLSGVLPTNFGNLTSLKYFYADNCRFKAPFPASFWTLPNIEGINLNDNPLNIPFPSEFGNFRKLHDLHLCTTGLTGTIPTSIGTLDSLGNLDICANKLTGSVPANLINCKNLQVFQIEMNQLDDLPDMSSLSFQQFFPRWTAFFSIQNNRFTFDDIVPNMPIINRIASTYAIQDSIFVDTTITATVSTPLSIDLKIDANRSANVYNWYKNGALFQTINGVNKLTFNSIQTTDAGIYNVKVTNPQAPLLTLNSRKIKIVVNPVFVDTTSCRYKDSLELVKLHTATNGTAWTNKWTLTQPLILPNGVVNTTHWKGIYANAAGCIINVTLTKNNLVGTLPNLNLPYLEVLQLDSNKLTGTIPNFNLPLLRVLNLDSNKLSSRIPHFNLPDLVVLNLSNNQLSDTIPNFSLPKLYLLDLNTNQLNGTIPNFNLPALVYCNLNNNKLTGNIPNFNLPLLISLYLDRNQLDGTIPNFNLPNLVDLYLYVNKLTGSIPNFNLPNLVTLQVSFNQLSGTLPTLQNLPRLSNLWINNNQLSGCFPIEWQRFCTIGSECRANAQLPWGGDFQRFCNNEAQIGASCNDSLATTINDKIQADCSCKGTAFVDTTSCRYKDSLVLVKFFQATNGQNWKPQTIVELGVTRKSPWILTEPMDKWLGIYVNPQGCMSQISLPNNGLSGYLPTELGTLSGLTYLNLTQNSIGSAIPTSLGNLTLLTHLDLSFNRFIDTIPASLGNLRQMKYFYLGSNLLRGAIPSSLGNLTNAIEFVVNVNQLTGTIPPSLGNLTQVELFLLADNQLTGTIPTTFGNFRNIKELQLYKNQLSGLIPTEIGNLTTMTGLYLSENKLTGAVPQSLRNLSNLRELTLNHNILDSLPDLSNLPLTGLVRVDTNYFTFDDILPIINRRISYAQQYPFFKDTTITAAIGSTVTVDLKIDGAITDNNYRWFKNDIEVTSLFSQKNKLILRGVVACDAGTYTCQVTNNRAPLLTLYSGKITLNIPSVVPTTRNKTLCAGQKDTLPSGRIVSPTVTTVYRDTVKSRLNPTCDSAITIINMTVLSVQTITKVDSFCLGKTYLLPQTNRAITTAGLYTDTVAAGSCSVIYVTTLSYRSEKTRTVNATLCNSQNYILPDGRVVTTEGTFTSRKTSAGECDSVITTILHFPTAIEAFDDNLELSVGDSVTLNLLLNDKLSGQNGRITILSTPTEGTTRRVSDSQIRYAAPQILRGSKEQTLNYKVCLNNCPNNCDSAALHIIIDDNSIAIGRIKNGVAPQISGEEYFEIDSIQAFTQSQLFIYNNWNELVFKSATPYDNRWKGTGQNDAPLPSGVYYYVLRHTAPNRKYLEGKILLLHDR